MMPSQKFIPPLPMNSGYCHEKNDFTSLIVPRPGWVKILNTLKKMMTKTCSGLSDNATSSRYYQSVRFSAQWLNPGLFT